MTATLQEGTFKFEPQQDWAKLPEQWTFGDCAGVAVDSHDNVYVLTRGEHPIIVLDKDGEYLRSFGEGEFNARAHGIHVSPDDFIYTTNEDQHCIKKYTLTGKLVMIIGKEHEPAEKWSGVPFNRPTNMAVSPVSGDIYVTDGYGNARIHRYTSDGRHIRSWGDVGVAPGEFQAPHNLVIDREERIFVNDRENNRVQVFDNLGNVLDIWQNIYRPQAMCMDAQGMIYVGEAQNHEGLWDAPRLGHRLNVFDHQGQHLARLGDPAMGDGANQFIAQHGYAVDSKGNLYVAECSNVVLGSRFNPPRTYKTFRRLERRLD